MNNFYQVPATPGFVAIFCNALDVPLSTVSSDHDDAIMLAGLYAADDIEALCESIGPAQNDNANGRM
jgi:hypothetical protein